jgi:Acetyltransferase (GNAT) domain
LPQRGETAGRRGEVTSNAELPNIRTPAPDRPEGIVTVNPLEHPEWDAWVGRHAKADFFHGTAWARVLQETYGHVPVYLAQFAGGKLEGMLPLMEVASRWTGRRGVSLPFTDFAFPLKAEKQGAGEFFERAMTEGRQRGWRYLECRCSDEDWQGSSPSLVFFGHLLDLGRGEEFVFKNLDGALRRGIRKAEAAGLRIQIDDTLASVHTYYALHCQTRRRHGLPPQPFRFFLNLQRYLLSAGLGFVVTAWSGNRSVAGAVFLRSGRQALYKFGASDFAFQNLRPNNLVMWAGIRECISRGCAQVHFGRTSVGNEGLRRFKLSFGTREEEIKYARYDFRLARFSLGVDRAETWANRVFACLPPPVLRWAGQLLYPHMS